MARSLVSALGTLALLVGVLAGSSQAALAYQSCQSSSSAQVQPPSAAGGQQVQFTGQFGDCNGQAVANSGVTFSQGSGPAGCTVTFSPSSTTTDSNGKFSTTVTLPPNCPGQFTLVATNQGVNVSAVVREINGFPNTTSAPAPEPKGIWFGWLLVALGALLMLAGGAGLALRRR